jgi:hypothetical protein
MYIKDPITHFKFFGCCLMLLASSCQDLKKPAQEGNHRDKMITNNSRNQQPTINDSTNNHEAISKEDDSKREDQIVNLIMNLEEVKQKAQEVEKLSHGKRHLSSYIETSPTTTDPYYWVKVAEDNGDNYVTYYTFAVDSKTQSIKYYDVINDSLVSLSQWRKSTSY